MKLSPFVVRTIAFQHGAQRAEEEVRKALHEFEELRHAFDVIRTEITSIRSDEGRHDRRRKFDDGPGEYAPDYFRHGPPPQR